MILKVTVSLFRTPGINLEYIVSVPLGKFCFTSI